MRRRTDILVAGGLVILISLVNYIIMKVWAVL